jgi:hypothetical protein
VKLRRRDQLLAQIGRRIDQKPVIAIGADRNRSLSALQFGMFGSRDPANRTSAVPLRNATPCRGAQDDDAKHDPSPGNSEALLFKAVYSKLYIQSCIFKAAKVDTGLFALPGSGTCHAWRSTYVKP